MNIDLYTMHYNEELIAPFVINYWKFLPLRKIFIIDNQSTDGSVDLIKKQFGDKVQIISFSTKDKFDDATNMKFKNHIWKQSRGLADFVIVCDFDECLYNENIMQDLQKMKKEDYSLIKTNGLAIIS